MIDLTALRAQFPNLDRLTYLDHAAITPLPVACQEGMRRYLDELGEWGATHYPAVPLEVLERTRQLGAQLMGGTVSGTFVVRSTSQGIAIVASGLRWKDGDNVVLVAGEFPANTRPWVPLRARGVELRLVEQVDGRIPLDALREATDKRTRAVSVSFVQFLSGFRIDVAAVGQMCRDVDALCVIDAIQGLGAFEMQVESWGVDFLSADSHKWMMGPEGVGLGYTSPRALDRIDPAVQGWLSVETPWDFFDLDQPLKASAGRYEEGAPNMAGLFGMNESLALILEADVRLISERLIMLSDLVAEGLESRGWKLVSPRASDSEKSAIVSARNEEVDTDAVQKALLARGVVCSARAGCLRVSPHAYQDTGEIAKFFDALDAAT